MNHIDELKHQSALHPLRYLMNQGVGVATSPLKTDTVNQGSIKLWTPTHMLRCDAVKEAILSARHPVNKGNTFFSRKIVKFKFEKCERYYHRFDLIALSGRVRPYLCSDQLVAQWEKFVRPNGPLFLQSQAVVSFFHRLFSVVNVPISQKRALLHALPVDYANVQAIGWQKKFSRRVETFFSRDQLVPLVTKDCTEGVREIGIGKLLAALKLDRFVFSGIGAQTKKGNSTLLMSKASFEFVNYADIQDEEITQFQGIGVVHALLHVHDGVWGNIARIEEKLRAYDLGKSLIPAQTIQGLDSRNPNVNFVSLMNADRETQITLCSALLETHYLNKPLPDEILKPLRDKAFIQTIESFPLGSFLDPQDPLRQDSEVLALAEAQFRNRAQKLYQLCQKKGPLTLEEIFVKLYPDEMRFVIAAKKLKMFCYHSIFPRRILSKAKVSPNLFSCKEIAHLEEALHRLESATLPIGKYQSFYS